MLLLSALLIASGTLLILIAGIGVVRLPDLFMRMSATTKAATLGVGTILVATMIHFGELSVTSRVLATICFVILTAPIAAHVIGRAAYATGVPLWAGTLVDELRPYYEGRREAQALEATQAEEPLPASDLS